MKIHQKIIIVTLLQILFFSDKGWAEPIPIFVSIIPQKYFVERIGGDDVTVEVMVNPGESPATFNPNPKKMSRLANSKLYFSIGVPFERIWISRLKAIHPDLQFISLHNKSSNPRDEHDPHIWLSPLLAKKMLAEIEAALSKAKPERAEFFKMNSINLAQELDILDQEIRDIIATAKSRNFMVFHPAWSYFAETYDLKQVAIEHQGKEPGPRALQKIINTGKKLNIKTIFVQRQFGLSVAKNVSQIIGANVEEIDPLAENYFENMRKIAKAISGANH